MIALTRRGPFQEFMLHNAMDQLMGEAAATTQTNNRIPMPLDLYETEQEYVVELVAPGLTPDSFEITIHENVLTIKGAVTIERAEGVRYHVQERRSGEFSRGVRFPTMVEAGAVAAELSNGILTVRVPKSEAAKPHRVAINAG